MHKVLSVLAFAAIAACSLTACKSQTEKSREHLATQSMSLRDSLSSLPGEIDSTIQKMMSATSGQNPKRADDARSFATSLESLKSKARAVASEANKAEVDGAKYFTAWAKEAQKTNAAGRPAVRAEAAAKRENYQIAQGYLTQARDKFNALIGDLDAINSSLKSGLSEQGVTALQPKVTAAVNNSIDTRNYIARVTDSIDAAFAK